MRRPLLCVLALISLVVFSHPAAGQQSTDMVLDRISSNQAVVNALSVDDVDRILTDRGIVHERKIADNGSVYFLLQFSSLKAMFVFNDPAAGSDKYTSIQVAAGFNHGQLNYLLFVNRWNKNHRVGTAWVADDGNYWIQSNLELEGGVTRQTIYDWLNYFQLSLAIFATTAQGQ